MHSTYAEEERYVIHAAVCNWPFRHSDSALLQAVSIVYAFLLPYTQSRLVQQTVAKCCEVRSAAANSLNIGLFSIRTSQSGRQISIGPLSRKWRNWQTHQLEGLAVAIP